MSESRQWQSFSAQARSRRDIMIKGRGIILRSIIRADVDRMAVWAKFSEPDLLWANFNPTSEGEKDWWFWNNSNDPTVIRLAMIPLVPLNPYKPDIPPPAEPEPIGLIGLRHINYHRSEATLGIRMSASTVGNGYGTAAIIALLGYSFAELGLQRVNLDVDEYNLRARRCYDKCGFQITGYHRSYEGHSMIDMAVDAERYHAALARLGS